MSPKNPVARDLLPLARKARQSGVHYDGFRVGAIGYVAAEILIEGANTKRTPDETKDCAEMKIMRAADKLGKVLDGLVIVGQPRKEDTAPTLHPCEACRTLMRAYMRTGKVIRPTAHITCVNALDSSVEEFTVETLHAAHGESITDE